MLDFSLYLITDRHQLPAGRTLFETVEQALKGGVRAVQLREKDLSARELLELALPLRELTRRYQARLLVNDRIDVALAAEADGVHLGRQSLPVAAARRLLGAGRLLGVSTHAPEEIAAAREAGADFVTFGPVYFTPSKAGFGPPQGLERLREACRQASLPVFALGGIGADQAAEVLAEGAAGIAVISAILTAPSPAEAARRFLALLPASR